MSNLTVNRNIESRGKTIQSVERAIAILETLAERGVSMSITEISENVGLKISTVHRFLSTLCNKGFIEQDPATSKYKLGMKLFQIGNAALYSSDIRTIAKPYLKELVDRCNETANLAILDGEEVVYIDQLESTNMVIVKMFAKVGSRGPAHCTGAGKVLLAYTSEKELEEILSHMELIRYTNETITDPAHLKKELERIRGQGYALDMGEREEDMRCVAAPVKNHENKVVAAISVSGPSTRMTTYYLNNELIPIVREVAEKISLRLGHKRTQS